MLNHKGLITTGLTPTHHTYCYRHSVLDELVVLLGVDLKA